MKNISITIFLLIIILIQNNINAQNKKAVLSDDFWGSTTDLVIKDDTTYMCSESPLSFFPKYKDLFPTAPTVENNELKPVICDKNYRAIWRIINETLYLCDIEIQGYNKSKYEIVENLTNEKFIKISDGKLASSIKVLPAVWFSGIIYLKRMPNKDENYCDCSYRCEPYKQINIEKGKIKFERVSSYMETSVDSIFMCNNRAQFVINNKHRLSIKKSPCVLSLEKSLHLNKNQRVSEKFYGETIDDLNWNGKRFMINISPISVFEGYKNIYPNIPSCEIHMKLPNFVDKNYKITWEIVRDTLYLNDVNFVCVDGKDEIYNNAYSNRYQSIEKLIGPKYINKFNHGNENKIPATWYSGTIYIKRYADNNESYTDCQYNCEPYYKIDIEKGYVKSVENVDYMIVEKKF